MLLAFFLLAGAADLVPVRWNSADPKSLDLLRNTPVNCVLLEAANWDLAFVKRATELRITSLGVVRPNAAMADQAHRATQVKLAGVLLEGVLTLLLTYFMLEARLRVRRHILVEREDFAGSLRAAAVLREMQSQIGTYFITNISVAGVIGIIVSAGVWAFGWDMPLMWGGLAAIFNLLPYIGPLTMIALLALFGLGSDAPLGWAIAPTICYGVLHATEANVVTPIIMGKRLAVSPVAILASLIFFSWVWGVAGALLAAPLLLILSVMLDYVGRPNLIGFLLGEPLISEPKISAGARTGSERAA